MAITSQRSATKSKYLRLSWLLGVALGGAGVLHGCGSPPPPEAPSSPSTEGTSATASASAAVVECPGPCQEKLAPPEDCWPEHEANVLLARLGVLALAATGRIAPELYQPDPGGATLQLSKTVKVTNQELRPQLDTAFADVQKNPVASRMLLAGRAAALAACGKKGCPAQALDVSLNIEADPEEKTSVYHFTVKDEVPPTLSEWEDIFLRQYSHISPHCSILGRSLFVPAPTAPAGPGAANDLEPPVKGYAQSGSDRPRTGAAVEATTYSRTSSGCCQKTPPPNETFGLPIGPFGSCRSSCAGG